MIQQARQRFVGEGLFIAECDIKSFFDSVSHDAARRALDDLIADAKRQNPDLKIDSRAIEIFDAYLSCYSFLRNVRQEAEFQLGKRRPGATYPWPEKDLQDLHGASSDLDGIGVPQGGALSSVIANGVLHAADKEVRRSCGNTGVTYLRYCDDTIVLAPGRDACAKAFDCYRATMTRLKLPIHQPAPLPPYEGSHKRSFWPARSKPVYHWARRQVTGSFPWIQFLGYQIRYDGTVRIRLSSIAKEHSNLVEITGRLLRLLRPDNVSNIRRSAKAITHRFRMKLISMAVGRRDIGQSLDKPLPKCWANGFWWLSGKHLLITNLRGLDRQRERQINRVSRRLKALDIQVNGRASDAQKVREYYGFPYSYVGQFKRSESAGSIEILRNHRR
jgi:hypothetical protein